MTTESSWAAMLRISVLDPSNRLRVFRLEGMVVGQWVDELRNLCNSALDRDEVVTVDLKGVSYVDLQGLTLLVSLRERQVALTNPQPFVAELLRTARR